MKFLASKRKDLASTLSTLFITMVTFIFNRKIEFKTINFFKKITFKKFCLRNFASKIITIIRA